MMDSMDFFSLMGRDMYVSDADVILGRVLSLRHIDCISLAFFGSMGRDVFRPRLS